MHDAHTQARYIPASGRHGLLSLYDPMVKLLGADRARSLLLDQAALRTRQRVLDVGCGTGTLVVEIKRRVPDAEVVGLDPDPQALARGQRKAAKAAVAIRFDQGYAGALPYADGSFDRVFSSYMLHHLQPSTRRTALAEIRRVLKPDGSLHLVDFDGPAPRAHNPVAFLRSINRRPQENNADTILGLMSEAGFANARSCGTRNLLLGRVTYYRAQAQT